MEAGDNLLETQQFIVISSSEIVNAIEKLQALNHKNHLTIHIVYPLKSIKILNILKKELEGVCPNSKIVLLEDNEKSKINLNVYFLTKIQGEEVLENLICNQLYNENKQQKNQLINYRNKLLNRHFIDNLTNLPNMYKLRVDLEEHNDFNLIIINIDNFQTINNFYGFIAGDYIIEQVAEYIKNHIPYHTLYRLYSDEFAIVVEKNMFFYDLKEYMDNLYNSMKEVIIQYRDIDVLVNFTLASTVKKDNEKIFSKVSMALKYAKKNKLPFWIYEDAMKFEKDCENNLITTKLVLEAISSSRIIPYYQAIVDTATSNILKYECLARLIDINGKVISPLDFIPISKQIKNYDLVTQTIINKSFSVFENLDVEFSVNVAIDDITNHDMCLFIMNKLKNSPISHNVTFEILESDAIEDFEKVKKFIKEVKRYGAKVAIDDFGSGYSNFFYLTLMQADFIKIDGSLVKNIDTDQNSYIVVENIVNTAKKLGIKTVAEFVHSAAVMEKVKELKIDCAQGYYFSKPSLMPK